MVLHPTLLMVLHPTLLMVLHPTFLMVLHPILNNTAAARTCPSPAFPPLKGPARLMGPAPPGGLCPAPPCWRPGMWRARSASRVPQKTATWRTGPRQATCSTASISSTVAPSHRCGQVACFPCRFGVRTWIRPVTHFGRYIRVIRCGTSPHYPPTPAHTIHPHLPPPSICVTRCGQYTHAHFCPILPPTPTPFLLPFLSPPHLPPHLPPALACLPPPPS